jgi:hypothetical protein
MTTQWIYFHNANKYEEGIEPTSCFVNILLLGYFHCAVRAYFCFYEQHSTANQSFKFQNNVIVQKIISSIWNELLWPVCIALTHKRTAFQFICYPTGREFCHYVSQKLRFGNLFSYIAFIKFIFIFLPHNEYNTLIYTSFCNDFHWQALQELTVSHFVKSSRPLMDPKIKCRVLWSLDCVQCSFSQPYSYLSNFNIIFLLGKLVSFFRVFWTDTSTSICSWIYIRVLRALHTFYPWFRYANVVCLEVWTFIM